MKDMLSTLSAHIKPVSRRKIDSEIRKLTKRINHARYVRDNFSRRDHSVIDADNCFIAYLEAERAALILQKEK